MDRSPSVVVFSRLLPRSFQNFAFRSPCPAPLRRPAIPFCTFFVATASSSSYTWSAILSRFWVAWMRKTTRKVTMVLPVLISSCHVSLKPNSGRVIAHINTTAAANGRSRRSEILR
jgi:hypothetical protein